MKPEFKLAKRLPGKSQLERVHAARAYLNQAGPRDGDRQRDMELWAFMSIFHPEVSEQDVRDMIRQG